MGGEHHFVDPRFQGFGGLGLWDLGFRTLGFRVWGFRRARAAMQFLLLLMSSQRSYYRIPSMEQIISGSGLNMLRFRLLSDPRRNHPALVPNISPHEEVSAPFSQILWRIVSQR